MRKAFLLLLTGILVMSLISCSGKRTLNQDNPYTYSSVKVTLTGGQVKEGIVIKRQGNSLYYVDAQTHKKDSLDYREIVRIEESGYIYDFEGNPIPRADIKKEKGINKTLTYGAGGLILGTAAGTAVGISLIAAGVDLDVPISMAVFGIAGAWMFGSKGSDRDFEDATEVVRKQRHKISMEERKRQIDQKKKELEQLKRKKEQPVQEND